MPRLQGHAVTSNSRQRQRSEGGYENFSQKFCVDVTQYAVQTECINIGKEGFKSTSRYRKSDKGTKIVEV